MILILIFVLVLNGCIKQSLKIRNNSEAYYDDSFFVQFNNQLQNGLNSSISNNEFQSFFNQQLKLKASSIKEIQNFNLDFHSDSNLVYVKINYSSGLTNEDRFFILNRLVEAFREECSEASIKFKKQKEKLFYSILVTRLKNKNLSWAITGRRIIVSF